MKTKLILTLAMLALASISGRAASIGTEFTYQGRLTDSTGAPSGSYDLTFTLHLAASGGLPIVTVTNLNRPVSNGLFTATVDFGGGIYNGNAYWISIGVRSNGTGGSFTPLTPRQPLTPTPNASYASLAGSVPGGSITSAKLAVDSVSNSALQNNAVTAAKVASGQLVKSVNSLRDDVVLSAGPNVTITPSGNTLTIAGSSGWNLGGNAGANPTNGAFLGTTDNLPVEIRVNGQRALRLEPTPNGTPNIIAGSAANSVAAGVAGVTIGGGENNRADTGTGFATIGGGQINAIHAGSHESTIGGGYRNTIETFDSTIGGGAGNTIRTNSQYSTIGGGVNNRIFSGALLSTIGGGSGNLIESNAQYSAIPGGLLNTAGGQSSFAAGYRAKAMHQGSFVWADSTDADFTSTGTNQFAIRATGGVRLSDNTPNLSFGTTTRQMLNLWGSEYGIGVQGSTVYFRTHDASRDNGFAWFKGGIHNDDPQNPGGGDTLMTLTMDGLTVNGIIVSSSDRNLKQNFAPVSSREVLEKVAALPITRWNFKGDAATPHVGPMAQDFHAAFGLGTDNKHIATVDADGVALAAIQGLNQKVEERSQKLEAENAELKQRLEKLERLMNHKNGGAK